MAFEAKTVVHDLDSLPRVTYAREVSGDVTITVELADLDPDRAVSPSESAAGILSLDPPQVYSKAKIDRLETLRRAVELASIATIEAVVSTLEHAAADAGEVAALLDGGEMAMINLRVTMAVKGAMRKAGEEI